MNNFALRHVPLFNTKQNNAENEGTDTEVLICARMFLIYIIAVESQII